MTTHDTNGINSMTSDTIATDISVSEAEDAAEVQRRLARVRTRIIESAPASEDLRSLSPDAAEALRELQPAYLHAPRVIGGRELSFTNSMRFIQGLGSFDASLAWCAAVASATGGWIGAYFGDEVIGEVFQGGTNWPLTAGTSIGGTATSVPGGYRVTGASRFTSGVRQSEYIVTGTSVDGDPHRPLSFVVPTAKARIMDDWHVFGLKGSGSSGFALEDVFVPKEWTVDVSMHNFRDIRRRGGATFTLLGGLRVTGIHAGVMLGAAERILDELTVALAQRIDRPSSSVGGILGSARREVVLAGLSTLRVRLDSMNAAAPLLFERLRAAAATEAGVPDVLAGESFAFVAESTSLAQDAATLAIRYASSSTLYQPNPIERYFRDVFALTHHAMHNDGYLGLHGSALVDHALQS
jgi:alkylation response protein AidB-like acyl-CoA dehydrogenase